MLHALPIGAHGKIVRQPLVVGVSELGPEHEGYHINVDRTVTPSIHGRLDSVYPTPSNYGRILVVNGKAYTTGAYEMATLTDD